MKRIIRYLSILLLFSGLISCVKETFDPARYSGSLNLRPGLAAPVGYSHIAIQKYLQKAIDEKKLQVSPDGFLSLLYQDSVFSYQMGDLIQLPQSSYSTSLVNSSSLPIELSNPGDSLTLTDTLNIPLNLIPSTLTPDSVLLLTGRMNIALNFVSTLIGNISLTFTGIEKKGIPLSFFNDMPVTSLNKDLKGYTLIPGPSQNLQCIVTLHLQYPTERIDPGNLILNTAIQLNALQFEVLYGNFDGYSFTLPDLQFSTGIFNEFTAGHFEFADPRLKLRFNNSVGIPLGIYFNRLDATDRNGQNMTLSGAGVPVAGNPFIIAFPDFSEMGKIKSDSLIFTRDNSDLPEVLASNPLRFSIAPVIGVHQNSGSNSGFIRYDSRLDLTASLDIPLYGKAEFLALQDTLAFDYLNTSLPPPEELEKIIVHLNIINDFPVIIKPQVYLLDGNRMLLDSLFTEGQQLEGASDENHDGIAEPHQQSPVDIELSGDKITNLKNTRYIVTRGNVKTTGYPSEEVKFYASYFLNYWVGLIAQLKINTSL